MRNTPSTAGKRLREIREQRGLRLRDVYDSSAAIARTLRSRAFLLPISRLHEIEVGGAVPSVHKLYTMSRVYRRSLNHILGLYGIPVSNR